MKAVDDYFKLQKEIFEYFGYVEDWKVIPLDDRRDCHWILNQNENGGGKVTFAGKPITPQMLVAGSEIYSNAIYTQRFLSKWVYRAEDYTMISCDTQCDGNKFLCIFSNDKEQQAEGELKKAQDEWDEGTFKNMIKCGVEADAARKAISNGAM